MKYGFREITDVALIDLATDKPAIFMDYLQTATQSIASEIVYATGGSGAPKRVGFQSGNGLKMELVSGLITPELLAIMFGTTTSKGSTYVPVTEVVTATSNTFTLAGTPIVSDLVNHPVTVAYTTDGTAPDTHLSKVSSTPLATEYSLTTKTVTTNSTTYATGGKFLVTYYKASSANNKRVKMQSNRYSKAYKLTGYTLWKNEGDDLFYPCYIEIPKLQITIDGNTLESAMNGDPTKPKLMGEAMVSGTNKDLIIMDIDEGAGFSNN